MIRIWGWGWCLGSLAQSLELTPLNMDSKGCSSKPVLDSSLSGGVTEVHWGPTKQGFGNSVCLSRSIAGSLLLQGSRARMPFVVTLTLSSEIQLNTLQRLFLSCHRRVFCLLSTAKVRWTSAWELEDCSGVRRQLSRCWF